MSTIERAFDVAAEAHAGQTDKAGMPYILHPLRVMLAVTIREEQMAAVLHDLVEDTVWTLDDLRTEGFPESVVAAVAALTRHEGEDYQSFVARAAQNPIARVVKLADLRDNSNLDRIPTVTPADLERLAKYRLAIKQIEALPVA